MKENTMNERIRVKVYPSEPNELILRVLEMPEKWRGSLNEDEGGYSVLSNNVPQIGDSGKTLYLRGGYPRFDNLISGWPYPTPEARNEALAAFTRIIRRLNGTDDTGGMVYGVPKGPILYRSGCAVYWEDGAVHSRGWHVPMQKPDYTKPLPALPHEWNDPAPTTHDGTVIE